MDRKKKLIVGFYAGGLPFTGDSLTETSLGGSETAVLYMARALAKRGHDVKVFNNCPKPGKYDRVDYFDFNKQWRDIAPIAEWDVFIVSRNYAFCAQPIKARLVGLWSHDIATDEREIMTNIWGADFIWCLSNFHTEQWLSVAKNLQPIMAKTRNGLDLELIHDVESKKSKLRDKNVFVWGSRPERGLDTLITHVWPKMLKELGNDIMLKVGGYSDTGLELPDHIKQMHEAIKIQISAAKNVERIEPLPKRQWYELLASSGMVIYPTHFPEISCITALEAQACKTPIVTSNEFALKETVKDRHNLISGHSRSEEYQNAFVARVKRLLSSDYEYKNSQRIGYEHVIGYYDWNTIAEEWEEFFWSKFKERSQRNGGRSSLRALMYKSDLLAAKWALDHPEDTNIIESECSKVRKDVEFFLEEHHKNPEEYDSGDPIAVDQTIQTLDSIARFNVASRHIAKHFRKESFSIVDVGCGTGRFLGKMLKDFSGQAAIMGIDFSEKLVKRAQELVAKVNPLIGDPAQFVVVGDFMKMNLPKSDDLADCIFAGEWLEHQQDIYGALERLEQWIKPGGLAVITIPSGAWEAITYRKNPNIRFHVSHFEFRDIEEIFGTKDFQMEYFPAGISPIDRSMLGNWIISWTTSPDKPFGQLNYLRKFQTIRPYQHISACLIAKDEEDNASRCLKSMRQIVIC